MAVLMKVVRRSELQDVCRILFQCLTHWFPCPPNTWDTQMVLYPPKSHFLEPILGCHSNLWDFSWILNQRQENRFVDAWLDESRLNQHVNSQRPWIRFKGDFSFNNLEKFFSSFLNTNVSKGIDISNDGV